MNSARSGYLVLTPGDVRVSTSPAIRIENSNVLDLYKGLDGEPWPVEEGLTGLDIINGLASESKIKEVLEYKSKLGDNSRLIHISNMNMMPSELKSGFEFCGFDFGLYESEYNFFSINLNEIIYGLYDEMRYFAQHLNSNLLFENKDLLNKVLTVRTKLFDKGCDLETFDAGDIISAYSIYIWKKYP